jgi:hypothetical protein
MTDKPQFWFNIKTKKVERGLKSSSLDRIGPFDSEQEAKDAEDIVRRRSAAWLDDEKQEE